MINSIYDLAQSTLSDQETFSSLCYFGKNIDNKTALDKIDRMAYWLKKNGIEKGDVIAICLPNIPDAVFSVYAVNKCGAVANLIHPLTPPLGLKKIIENTGSRMLFYVDAFYVKGAEILAGVKTVVCSVGDYMPPFMAFAVKLSTRKARKVCKAASNVIYAEECYCENGKVDIAIQPEDIAAYLHSGGTSGIPKTITITNRSLNACYDKTGVLVGDIKKNEDAMLMALPLFHGFGLGVALHTALCKGGKVVLMPRFSGKEAAKRIKKDGVTYIAGVPQMYNKLMDASNFAGPHLKRLKNVYCGGDKLPKGIKDRWDKLMQEWGGSIEILEGYGLTEMLTVSNVNVPGASRPGSVGKPLVGIMNKIIDEDGNTLPPDSSGEICISGSTIMSGYLNDKEANSKVFLIDNQGVKWIRTGDCGYIDKDGYLYFRERIKRMIKVSGINVFPQEIEYTVTELPEIKYACALEIMWHGKPAIKLYVVLHKDYELTDELRHKITEYIGSRLMKYSVPRVIEEKDALPLTQIGKVDFMRLFEQEKASGCLSY